MFILPKINIEDRRLCAKMWCLKIVHGAIQEDTFNRYLCKWPKFWYTIPMLTNHLWKVTSTFQVMRKMYAVMIWTIYRSHNMNGPGSVAQSGSFKKFLKRFSPHLHLTLLLRSTSTLVVQYWSAFQSCNLIGWVRVYWGLFSVVFVYGLCF